VRLEGEEKRHGLVEISVHCCGILDRIGVYIFRYYNLLYISIFT